jgi:hypothetical protein
MGNPKEAPMRSLRCLALLLLAAAGCTWSVHSHYDHTADLYRYRTYAWASSPAGSTEDSFARSMTGQRMQCEVARQLAARGVVPAAPGQKPDFKIAYQVAENEVYDADWGDRAVFQGAPDVYRYTRGTLRLKFVDPASGVVFWRGQASRILDNADDPHGSVERAVDKMMARYPASQHG